MAHWRKTPARSRVSSPIRPERLFRRPGVRSRHPHVHLVVLVQPAIDVAEAEGQGLAVTVARFAAAIHYNGLGRYADAEAAAGQASRDHHGWSTEPGAAPHTETVLRSSADR